MSKYGFAPAVIIGVIVLIGVITWSAVDALKYIDAESILNGSFGLYSGGGDYIFPANLLILGNLTFKGNTTVFHPVDVNGSLSPVTNNFFDLGNTTNTWHDLYLSGVINDATWNGTTITQNHLGGIIIPYGNITGISTTGLNDNNITSLNQSKLTGYSSKNCTGVTDKLSNVSFTNGIISGDCSADANSGIGTGITTLPSSNITGTWTGGAMLPFANVTGFSVTGLTMANISGAWTGGITVPAANVTGALTNGISIPANNVTSGTFSGYYNFSHNVTMNGTWVFGYDLAIAKNFTVIMYNGSDDNSDGWRLKFLGDFLNPNNDYLVFDKTDGNDAVPDGGFAWIMTNKTDNSYTIMRLDGNQKILLNGSVNLLGYNISNGGWYGTPIEQTIGITIPIENATGYQLITTLPYGNITGISTTGLTQANISGLTLPFANITGFSVTGLTMANISGEWTNGITVPIANVSGYQLITTLPFANITSWFNPGITLPLANVTGAIDSVSGLTMNNITGTWTNGITVPIANVSGYQLVTTLPQLNITGYSSYNCTGTDKLMNVSLIDGIISGNCSAVVSTSDSITTLPFANITGFSVTGIAQANLSGITLPVANITGAWTNGITVPVANVTGYQLVTTLPYSNITNAPGGIGVSIPMANITDWSVLIPMTNITDWSVSIPAANITTTIATNQVAISVVAANVTGAITQSQIHGLTLPVANVTGVWTGGISVPFVNVTSPYLWGFTLPFANITGFSVTNIAQTNISGLTLPVANITGALLSVSGLTMSNITGAWTNGITVPVANVTGAWTNGITVPIANVSGYQLITTLPYTNITNAPGGVGVNIPSSNVTGTWTGGTTIPSENITNSRWVNGSGTLGYICLWNETNSINNSIIYQNGTNIGIGTANPSNTLDVGATGIIETSWIYPSDEGGLAGIIYLGPSDFIVDTRNGIDHLGGVATGGGAISREYGFHFIGDSETKITRPGAGEMAFSVNTLEAMRIDSTGYVGIGTTTPGTTLDVNGNVSIVNNIYNATWLGNMITQEYVGGITVPAANISAGTFPSGNGGFVFPQNITVNQNITATAVLVNLTTTNRMGMCWNGTHTVIGNLSGISCLNNI